ncbi:cofactor-independent phosphoglycerate mutase [Desulfococcaceae bacterium HSG7]|nr:cofactor-independent phosphoglycerate mutase [Desulfococcaceae bacterium HSG7]
MNRKYVVLIPDGMADDSLEELGGLTPLEAAETPNMDALAAKGIVGLTRNVPPGMSPGSDVAIMSVLGYDPAIYHTGRAPLEAPSVGVELTDGQIAFRMNFVTIERGEMVDFAAGHITDPEAVVLVEALQSALGSDEFKFYPGASYRHLMVTTDTDLMDIQRTPPHDIIGQPIENYLAQGPQARRLLDIEDQAASILDSHEINLQRKAAGKNPANKIWLWGQGTRPQMPLFNDVFGISGGIISAVPLLQSLAAYLGLKRIEVDGITGYLDTNYIGKGDAAVEALKTYDFVCVHVEAPDEAGHSGDWQAKIEAIERIDHDVLGTVIKGLRQYDEWRILVLADHPTPVTIRTHTREAVPFVLCGDGIDPGGIDKMGESHSRTSGVLIEEGRLLIKQLFTK